MEYIYTFVGGSFGYRWLSKQKFRRQFGLSEALGYLQQIRGSLIGEARDHRYPVGLYTGLRNAFAELDGLGKLYEGSYGTENTATNAVSFGTHFLARVNRLYEHVFGLIFDLYRHGLVHGHLARSARYRKNRKWHFVHWALTDEKKDHLSLHTEGTHTMIIVSVPQLVEDTIAAIDLFSQALKAGGKKSRLLSRFKRGYEGACTSLREPIPATAAKKGNPKLRLKAYSRDGLDWIRRHT
jgi:hypothetical protein